jgi:hypothetical protein
MEDAPRIVMQCPKCRREYCIETSYCDKCSALLEPVEIAPPDCGETAVQQRGSLAQGKIKELLEDIKLDYLKTDIELAFVRTLLLELSQLNTRFSLRYPSAKQVDSDFEPDNSAETGQTGEGGGTYIEKRISKINATLHNLEKKMEADISELNTRLDNFEKPGVFGFLTDKGRLYRMLSSELNVKRKVLISIKTKNPSSRGPGLWRASMAAMFVLVIFVAGYSSVLTKSREHTSEEVSIGTHHIVSLLEDIKSANLRKDPALWESRYSKNYLAMDSKKENQLEIWNNYDYTRLDYRIDAIESKNGSAVITWEIELRSMDTGSVIRSSQTLSADFIKEDGKFKISAVRVQGSEPFS